MIGWVSDWLIDWLIDRLIDWVINWLLDWLIDWLMIWFIDWLSGRASEWASAWVSVWVSEWVSASFEDLKTTTVLEQSHKGPLKIIRDMFSSLGRAFISIWRIYRHKNLISVQHIINRNQDWQYWMNIPSRRFLHNHGNIMTGGRRKSGLPGKYKIFV